MKRLKKFHDENPGAFWLGVSAVLTGTASVILLKNNAKLQGYLAENAKEALNGFVEAFNEGYNQAVFEIEEIASNKELQKALKSAAKSE